jgi:hypothetical protein
MMTFAEALGVLRDKFGIDYPYPIASSSGGGENKAGYVPLMSRKFAENYEEKKEHLGGSRKERLERHLQLDKEEKDAAPEFFSRMRSQGNI